MGIGINVLDIGELSAKIREYLQDVIDKGGTGRWNRGRDRW